MRAILVVFVLLVTWKMIHTDWIVICPSSRLESDTMIGWSSHMSHYNAIYRPPTSPVWKPPSFDISGVEGAKSWREVFPDTSASFSHGPIRISPDWERIRLKVGLPLVFVCAIQILRFIYKRRRSASGRNATEHRNQEEQDAELKNPE